MTFCHCSLAVITENSNLWKIETTAVVLDSAHFECLPIKPGLRTTKLSIYRTFRYSDSTIFLQQFYKKDHVISN